ncbi:hypothetical protein Taro_041165 [Colocasia esculenta]|uniref:STAS domain-containing protein n=1 Tax=Colocasia esculenta TaxID=4460 RepID=A0A843WF33_COLES|nr:hypothetical protein [Colocasia esculenta]
MDHAPEGIFLRAAASTSLLLVTRELCEFSQTLQHLDMGSSVVQPQQSDHGGSIMEAHPLALDKGPPLSVLNSPAPPGLWEELSGSVREAVLPRKGKLPQACSLLQGLFPIIRWGRRYDWKTFRSDLMAGLTLASLGIPQSIGYASLAKLDPQYGLYTSVVPPLIYAVMGSSREIAIGPVAVISLLLSSMVEKVVDPFADPTAYRRLVFTATFFAGLFQAAFGLFRLGFLVDFLSHAALVGFMGGAAIIIGLQQLKGLLGISHFTNKTDVVSVIKAVWVAIHEAEKWNGRWYMNVGDATRSWSFSRTAVNFSANCKTAVSNIVMAITVIISLELLTGLLYYTPTAILASIILSSLPGLIDVGEAHKIWKVDKLDFTACLGAFFGVLFGSVEIGLVSAVAISFAKIILNSLRPRIEVLGRLEGTEIFCSIRQFPLALKTPKLLTIRIDSAFLSFVNANFVRERILSWVAEDRKVTEENPEDRIRAVVIDMSNVMNIDMSGIIALEEVHKQLSSHGLQVAIANPSWLVIHKIRLAKLSDRFGDWFFLTVGEAVEACLRLNKNVNASGSRTG